MLLLIDLPIKLGMLHNIGCVGALTSLYIFTYGAMHVLHFVLYLSSHVFGQSLSARLCTEFYGDSLIPPSLSRSMWFPVSEDGGVLVC